MPENHEAAPASLDRLPRLLTIPEVARATRAPESTVRHWLSERRLASVKVGRRRLVREADLLEFLGGERA